MNKIDPTGLATDSQLAGLSECAYDTNCSGFGGFERQNPSDFGLEQSDLENDNGFRAGIFSNGKETVVAFGGSDSFADVDDNGLQIFGASEQYNNQVASLATAVSAAVGEKGLSFTGHSLGGGLASLAGALTGRETTVFNPAGVSNATLSNFNLSRANGAHVNSIFVRGDPLNGAQRLPVVPNSLGTRTLIGSCFRYLGEGNPFGLLNHSIGTVRGILKGR